MSCEVTGLRNENRYRLRPGAGVSLRDPVRDDNVSFPASALKAEAGKANTRISSDSWRDLRLDQLTLLPSR